MVYRVQLTHKAEKDVTKIDPNLSISDSKLSEILSTSLKQAKNGEAQDLDSIFKSLLKDL